MRRIHLRYEDLMLDAGSLAGEYLDPRHHDRTVRDTATVLKPDGRLLLIYATDLLPPALCREARDALAGLRPSSNNREVAGGVGIPAPTAVLGYMDRSPRAPWCRLTAFTRKHYSTYKAALPLFVEVNRKYGELAPRHWAAQQEFTNSVSPDFTIPRTAFTSASLNRHWRTRAHADLRNHRPGLEAVVVLEGDGGELVFPCYRTAVDVRPGGLLLADMREVHGNAPLGLRLSLVLYARAGMCECASAEEEWRRAAGRSRHLTT